MSNQPTVDHVGTLTIPISQKKMAQVFSWIQRRGWDKGQECPFDPSLIPSNMGLLRFEDSTEKGDFFFIFREVRLEDSVQGDLPEVVLVFDRMRILSEDKTIDPQEIALPYVQGGASQDVLDIAESAQEMLIRDHGITIGKKFLTEALRNGSVYSDVTNALDLVERILTNVRHSDVYTTD